MIARPRLAGSLVAAALACGASAALAQQGGGVLPGATAKTPVEIDAANLKWNDAERMATYEGEVVVTQGEATLHAKRLRVYLVKDQAKPAAGKTPGKTPDKTPAKTPAKAAAPAADVGPLGASGSADIRRIEADGPVTVVQKDQVGAGDRGEYDKARDRIVLDGHVVLTQGPNVTGGARMTYRIASRDVVVEGGGARVRSQFVQEQPAAGAAKATPAAGAAKPAAQEAAFPGAGSSREPIQIEANRLEWFDATQRAVYSGAVTAVQGESALRASRMTIFVLRDKAKGAQTAPGAGGKGQIRRIECDGPVTVTQKDQVATGSRAIYDKPANRVELIGNVTLTQGENVTTGQRMIYDLATKQATMIGAGAARAQAVFEPSKGGSDPFGAPGGGAGKPKR